MASERTTMGRLMLATLAICAVAGLARPAAAEGEGGTVEIVLDRAQVFAISEEARTLIIGNPAIADVNILRPGLMVVTGKAFGLTNLVSLDKDGKQISNAMLRVTASDEQMVTVMRGGANETLHCPPGGVCASTITLGDAPEAFGKLVGQVPTRQGLAQSAPPASPAQ
jgi:hypothetical protein